FNSKKVDMYINGDYRLEIFELNITEIPIDVITGFKDENGESPVMTWVDSSYGIVENTENEEEALRCIEVLTSQEFGQLFSDNLNRVSAIEGVTAEHEVVQKITKALEENLTPYLMLVHYGEGSTSTKTILEDGLQGLYLKETSKEEHLKKSQENAGRGAEEEVEELEMIEEDD